MQEDLNGSVRIKMSTQHIPYIGHIIGHKKIETFDVKCAHHSTLSVKMYVSIHAGILTHHCSNTNNNRMHISIQPFFSVNIVSRAEIDSHKIKSLDRRKVNGLWAKKVSAIQHI